MATTVEVLSVSAALVSAIGGAFAAWAAFRSAASARLAQESADTSERRVSLRDLTSTARAVVIEAQRVAVRGGELKREHQSLAIMSGASISSSLDLSLAAVEAKLTEAKEQAKHAELFASSSSNLEHASSEEIDRVQLRLSDSLKKAQATLEDFDREHGIIERQCAARRQSMDQAKYAR
jgi:hypothetical protein